MNARGLGWLGICRLGLVQTALGAVVVLTTSTFNRVMVVELSLFAVLPGLLVAAHYAIQILRPRFGHGSDQGGRRTPWIIGGVVVLGVGGTLAAAAIALATVSTIAGIALSVVAYLLIGAGVGAAGTSLLVMLAEIVRPERRAAAATITWIMMIAGFIVTTTTVGALLDPFTMERLVFLTAAVSIIALAMTLLAIGGIENKHAPHTVVDRGERAPQIPFAQALRDVMSERKTRRFGFFVFLSMLAYSAQDLLLEPFAGEIFNLTPGDSTQLGGVQHGGVLLGMLSVGLICSVIARGRPRPLRICMIGGCVSSALMLLALAYASWTNSTGWPLVANVFALGVANGLFAVAAISSMMMLVSEGHENRDGVRMGVWGAAQAMAFGLGGIAGTVAVDLTMWWTSSTHLAYALAFILQASLFLGATIMAISLSREAAAKLREHSNELQRVAS